jgi:hypothetical protein
VDWSLIQHVHFVPRKRTGHNTGHPDDEASHRPQGKAGPSSIVTGEVWYRQWSELSDPSPTAHTVDGTPMRLTPGRTWFFLVAD